MKIEIANKIETMIRNEEKHLDWLQSNNAPQEFIELSRWYIDYYTERLKEYRESLATPQKEVLGSGNAMGTTKILVANSKGEEIFKIKDDIITINMSNMESKKVTLNNGTVLEVGKKYKCDDYTHVEFVEIKVLGDRLLIGTRQLKGFLGTSEEGFVIDSNWLPYTAPQEEVKWKTFLIETLSQKTDVPYRFFSQYYSMEDAREHHKRAISIQEVKLNIEPVNS